MTRLGVSVVLSWNIGEIANAGMDILGDSEQLRKSFADFRAKSDLKDAWSGAAADAQVADAKRLAADIYACAEMLGAISSYVNEEIPAIENAIDTIKKTRALAEADSMVVHEDGTVVSGPYLPLAPLTDRPGTTGPFTIPKPGFPYLLETPDPRIAKIEAGREADCARYTKTIQAALQAATDADIELAGAIAAAKSLAQDRATDPVLVGEAVAYVDGAKVDPFISDQNSSIEPDPTSPEFLTWLYAQLPSVRFMVMSNMGKQIWPKGFDPYSTVQGGEMPSWATDFNNQNIGACPGPTATGYGYLGGGSIAGPGGGQWPIVIPYYSDGKTVYTQDGGGPDGIDQLGGKDPGWHTVYTASGQAPFGTTSRGTNLLVALAAGTGADIQTTHTDPGAIYINSSGRPVVGHAAAAGNASGGTPNEPYWSLSKPDLPSTAIKADVDSRELDNNAGGAASLVVQAGQGIATVNNLNSQASRQYYVSYQVNDDGRTRAILNTYSAATGSDGKLHVGGLATTFPHGKGSTTELPINVHQPANTPSVSQTNIVYMGNPGAGGGPIYGTQPITQSVPH